MYVCNDCASCSLSSDVSSFDSLTSQADEYLGDNPFQQMLPLLFLRYFAIPEQVLCWYFSLAICQRLHPVFC